MANQLVTKQSGFMSWFFGDGERKTIVRKARKKTVLSKPQIELTNVMSEISSYILANAECSISASSPVNSIAFSGEEAIIYFATSKGTITCFNYQECKCVNDIILHIGAITHLLIVPSMNRAIVCCETPVIRVYSVPKFELLKELTGHQANVNKIFLNNKYCYSSDISGSIFR